MLKLKNNNPKGTFPNRLLWPALIHVSLMCFTIFLVVKLWNRFLSNPTVTSLENSVYPVANIPYPGVAFCNINKISRKRAQELAEHIASRTGRGLEEVMQAMGFLGHLYDSSYEERYKGEIEDFQTILDSLELKIKNLMRELVTPCEEFLQTCYWKGVEVDCSDIFYMRLTFEGYCCAFNYVKNTSEWWKTNKKSEPEVEHLDSIGTSNGLSVVINNNLDDYFHTILSSTGITVHVFIPTDYPDKSSGNLIESIAEIGSENFLEVIPTTVAAVRDVMNYPVNKRECLFEVEQLTQFGVYSQSDCFVDCRVRSMMTLCECIPFTIPLSHGENVCTLRDLPCLSRYRNKWLYLVTETSMDVEIREQEDALFCPDTCHPSCEGTLYEVSTSAVPLLKNRHQNHTTIHVYYRDRYHNLYKQDVVHYWFEILSNYGGIFGIMMGLSFISVLEGFGYFIKFITGRC